MIISILENNQLKFGSSKSSNIAISKCLTIPKLYYKNQALLRKFTQVKRKKCIYHKSSSSVQQQATQNDEVDNATFSTVKTFDDFDVLFDKVNNDIFQRQLQMEHEMSRVREQMDQEISQMIKDSESLQVN